MNWEEIDDLIIIGGGPIGMFAAYYAGMRHLKTTILETLPVLGGQIALMYPDKTIIDIGGVPEIRGVDLIKQLNTQVATFQPAIFLEEKVLDIQKIDDVFHVTTAKNQYFSKAILLTTGQGSFKPRTLNIDGADRYEGKNLHYYVTDVEKYRNKHVLICGGGDSAVEWALMLENVAKKVTIAHRRQQFRAHENFVEKLLHSSVEILTPYVPEALSGDGNKIQAVTLKERRSAHEIELPIDELIISYGFASNNQLLADWGLELEHGSLLVNQQMSSNIPGIFGAGDGVTYDGKVKLIAVGFGESPIAVNSAVQYIHELENRKRD